LRKPDHSGLRLGRAENAGMNSVRNGEVIFDLAVNADTVHGRAGDTGEVTRRTVHAGKGRVRTKYACDGLAAAPHNAASGAISNHTEAVVRKFALFGVVLESNV